MYDSETGTGTPDTPLPYWDSETGQGTPTIPNYYFDSETGISWSRGGGGGFYWDGLNEPQFSFTPEQQQQLDSFVANPTLSGLETNPLGYGGPLFRFTEPQSAPVQAPPPPPPEPVYQAPVTPQPAPIPPPAPTVTTPTPTASPTMATSTTSNIDPTIQPYLSYGLQEAQKQYQAGGPQYYGGQTYVSPSQTTQTGLQALEARASQGSPLTGAAQGQLQNTIQGGYLQGNPFFQGAFKPAAQAAESQFLTSLGNIGSAASKAGRYGSGAMNTMQQGASGQFAKTLADTAGTLAYQNYDAERSRQQAATMAAPQMAQADYGDIQNMLKAGQLREGYTGAQQQADINRFNFQQNQPQVNLTNYLSGVYGNPMGRQQLSAGGGQAGPSGFQNLLGTAATLGGLYKNVGGVQGLSNIGNWLSGGNSVSNLNPYSGEYMGSLEF